jgi:CheY-like chemotaxis protein
MPAFPADVLAERRVLVVNANPVGRELLAELLARYGAGTATVGTARGALEQARSAASAGQPFDAALLDQDLADDDVPCLARRLRDDPLLAGLPIVLLATRERGLDTGSASAANFDARLNKPAHPLRIVHALAEVIGLPAPTRLATPAPDVRPAARPDAPHPVPGRSVVLVAEDNPINQKVALRMLESLGWQADLVADGNAAVAAAARRRYAAIFMDCQMPGIDGYEATRRIRAAEADRPRTPIIAMTAHAMRGDRELALQAGMDDYLSKPVARQDLAAAIEHWIQTVPPIRHAEPR